jgi:outer membrane protein TolC
LSYLPNVGVQAAVRESNVAGFTAQTRTWFATLGLNWTLWDGGLREASLKEGAAREAEAEAALKSARLKAADEVRRARLDLDSARENRLKAEETVKLAREGRDLVEVGFKAGTSTYVEVADATTALVGAELGRIAETLNARLAVLKLAKAAGAFDPR